MPVFTTIMILILIASLTVCLFTVWRLFTYNSKYHLPEIKYTKLFRVLTKEHFAIIYVLFVILHLLMSVWFIWTL